MIWKGLVMMDDRFLFSLRGKRERGSCGSLANQLSVFLYHFYVMEYDYDSWIMENYIRGYGEWNLEHSSRSHRSIHGYDIKMF